MSDLFFKHEKISANDYVSVVRHMYMFKTMIQLQNDTFFIEITEDGNVVYVGNGGVPLENISEYMKSATVDSDFCYSMSRILKLKIELMCLKCYSLYIKQFLLVL